MSDLLDDVDEEPHDTGYPLLDATCEALDGLCAKVREVAARLEKSHPAHPLLSWIAADLPWADDRLWQGRGWNIVHNVELLNDAMNDYSLPTNEELTGEMVNGLSQAARVATAKLRACIGYGRFTTYTKAAGESSLSIHVGRDERPTTPPAAIVGWPDGRVNARNQFPVDTPM